MVKRTVTITTILLILTIVVSLLVVLNKSSIAVYSDNDFYAPPSELPGNGSTVVDSDVQETCTWRLYSDGTMVISPTNGVSGNLGNISMNMSPANFHNGSNPSWRRIKDSVNYIIIENGVSAGIALGYAFSEMSSLEYVDLRNLDTSNCTASMVHLFSYDTSLKKIDFGQNFSTSQIVGGIDKQSGARRYMQWIFDGCTSLEELDLSVFDVTGFETDPYSCISTCSSLRRITLGNNWKFTHIKDYFPRPPSTGGYTGKWIREDGTGQAYTPAELAAAYTNNPSSMVGTWVWQLSPVAVFTEDQTLYMVRPSKILDLTNNVGTVQSISGGEYTGQVFSIDEMNTSGTRTWASVKSQVKKVDVIDDISPRNTQSWFEGFSSCTEMDLEKLDTSESTKMSSMFSECKALTTLDLSGFDTSKVTNMQNMFLSCYELETIDISNFDTGEVTDMSNMFNGCFKLTSIDTSRFNTEKVTHMSAMFADCRILSSIDVSGFNTEKVISMHFMFDNCYELSQIDVSGFDTRNVTNMGYMFSNCRKLAQIDVSGFNTEKVIDMHGMFNDCCELAQIDVSGFNTENVTDMGDMFNNCPSLNEIDVSGFRTDNVTDMSSMFNNCQLLTQIDVSGFNTSQVKYMNRMFASCEKLTSIDVSDFNTANTINMSYMFSSCKLLTQIDVSGFETSKVTNMQYMFANCKELTSIDLSGFNTSKVTNMKYMFGGSNKLTSIDVSSFNTEKVTDMDYMFFNCKKISSLDLSSFDTSNVTTMKSFLTGADDLDVVNLGENFSFDGQGNIINKAILPTPTGERFTGKWIREDGAYGPYTPEELRYNYDGVTMAGNWIRERRPFSVTYSYIGTSPQGASELPETQMYQAGTEVTVAPDATAPGYIFNGWSRTGNFTMPEENVEITGSFTANTDTQYRVEHYVEDLNADTFSLRETEYLEGETDSTVFAYEREYEGFTYDYTVDGTLQSGEILGDGSLVLKLYYTRNSYTVSYAYTSAPVSADPLPADQSYQYGAEVTIAPDATAPGYTFSGWSRTNTFTMPAENVEITGSFTANTNTPYKIEHYTKDLNANTYTLRETENKTGTTDILVTATAKTYEGFTFNNSINGTIQSGYISGDGNLTLKLYYTRNSYNVSYEYTSAPVNASLLPADQSYQYGAEVTVALDATAPGYTFSGWSRTGTFTMPAENVEITGSFTANTNTPYKIEHYTKDLNANTYTLRETENKTGTTDTLVTATAKTYEGFTFNNSINGTVQSGYISGDGNLTLKLYYTRNSYTVSYEYQGYVPTGASSLPSSQSYEYGTEVTVAPDATAPGYTFNGWNRTGTFTMPAEDVTIKGSFSSNSNTIYKVEHYKENINSSNFTLFETDTLAGETDTEVTATPNTYEGFTFNSGRSTTTGTITGDGNLVLKLYYNRNSYTVSYAYQGNVPTGASSLPTSQSYEYGAEVTVAADSTAPGYTFSGWSRNGTFTMPAEDVEITGSFTANTNTPYKIEHYTKDLNANTYTLRETENKTGTTDTNATATPKSYEGFTFNAGASNVAGTISGDGNLTLKLYYTRNSYTVSYAFQGTVPTGASSLPTSASYQYGAEVTVAPAATAPGYTFSGWSRTGTFTMPAGDVQITGRFSANTDTAYKIEHYIKDLGANTYTLKETENKIGTTDTNVTATPKSYEGFTFDDSITGTLQTGTISGDGNLTLKLYYTRNSYTVSYAYQGNVPTGASSLPTSTSYQYGTEVTVAPDATAPGYTFSGWSRTGTFTMPAEDVQITGRFSANTDTAYKIEHYIKDLGANTYTLKETENKTGKTDTNVTATPKSYEGFTFDDSITGTLQSGTISGNGNLTLKLYYTRNSYTVSYAYTSAPVNASLLPADQSYEYGAEVTVAPNATASGYTFSGWSRTNTFTMPAEDVEITGSFTANTNTPYKIEHYKQKVNNDQFTLFETENKTGTTDTLVTAAAKNYEGFTFDNSINGTLQSGYISGDGNLTLKLYYTRNSYTVSYAYTSAPVSASLLPADQSYKYGAEVTVAADSIAPGYTFSGWSRTGAFTMPAENVEITGSFTANENTSYKIEHYTKDLNANTYTLKETENKTGTTDTLVTATSKTYEGFTFNNSISGTVQSGYISGDGNLTLKLYYTRNNYTVSYAYQGNVPAGASNLPSSQSYEYGAEVTVAADSTAPGYTFSGWSRTGTFTMPAEDVTIKGSFVSDTDTTYKVEHYKENINSNDFTLFETETLTGETDTEVTATPNTYAGFTFNSGRSTTTGTISGDGNLVLKLYYNRDSYTVSYAYQGNVPTGASNLPASNSYEYEAEVTVALDATAPGYTFSGWSRTSTFTMPAQDVEITGSFTANTNTSYKVEHYTKDLNASTYTLRETENKTGTTDTSVTATPKNYDGFTFNSGASNVAGTISGDGNLVLKLYYNRNSYTVSYAYQGTVPVGASNLPANSSYQYGAEVTVAPDATAPGYTFSGWSRTGTFTMPAEDVEITGSFTANTNTAYKIEHYTKDLNANTYTLRETENKTGTTDTSVTATPKSYGGFTFNAGASSVTGTISGDGNLTLKLYYNRNSYVVSYAYQGDVPTGASSLPANQSYQYEAEVTVAPDATAPGYTFSGWSRTGTFTMPAEDVEITGSFTSNNNTNYKVEHYKQNVNNNQFTLFETENKMGTTDVSVTATAKIYEGFTFDDSIPGTMQSGTISGDGNLTLKLYYTRNSYTVSYAYTSAPVSASLLPADSTYKYEEDVTVEPNATAPGYTFSGWSRTGTFTMPAEDVEITGSFTVNTNTPYKIEHYTKDLNANTYTLRETENKTGTTDTLATANAKTYEGFTFNNSINGTVQSGYISGDGNLTLKLYYTRNSYNVSYEYQGNVPAGASSLPSSQNYEFGTEVTVAPDAIAPGYTFNGWNRTGTFTMPAEDVTIKGSFSSNSNTIYKVEHYKENINSSNFTLFETDTLAGETDTEVTATPNTYDGFTFNSGRSTTTGTISGDGNLVLKLYYNRNSYIVSYAYQGNVPTGANSVPTSTSYEYGAEVTVAADSTAPGYTFSGWSRSGTFTMPAEDVEITGSFTANTNTPYKIEHYTKDLNANTYTLRETENKTGTTDTSVSAIPKSYEGFTYNAGASNVTGTISGDGNLVLKLYYNRNSYTVSYAYQGNVPTGASSLPSSQNYEYGAEVTVAADSTAPGYTFSGWSRTGTFTMPAEDVEITGRFTANTNTAYKIEHYKQNVNNDQFTIFETENKTGTTDNLVTADSKSYEGFTFDDSVPGTVQSGTISGDGYLTLKFYYTRNSYTVSYAYTSAPVTASLLPADSTYKYGTEVIVEPSATAPGYTFSGWSRTGTFEMPAEDVEITGSFTANTNTAYKIEHYTKDLNANTYTLKETENKTGTTDTLVTATAKTYEGFTFNNSISGTVQSGYISGDGNLTLKLYYTRNSYTVSYAYQGTVPAGASSLPANNSYEFEAEVTVAPDATAPGYTFSGWSRTGTFTMPAEDVTIKGSFASDSDTTYKVEHYKENINSNTYTLFETETLTGETDTEVTATPNTYTGFTFNSGRSTTTGTISGDGNLTLKLYYNRNSYTVSYAYQGNVPTGANSVPTSTSHEYGAEVTVAEGSSAPGYTFSGWSRTGTFTMPAEDVEITGSFTANTNTSYKVEHYTKDLNASTYTLKETENKSGTTDTSVTAIPKTYEGFSFDSGVSSATGIVSGNGNLVLKLYYNRNSYTVSYAYQGNVPTGANSVPTSASYEYGADVIVAQNATAPGYTFSGWSRTGTFMMPAEDVEITGSFTANTNTSYKVEHYTKDLNASTYTLKETENRSGTTDTSITAMPKSYEGFTYNAAPSTQTGIISGDGNLTLKLYYNRNSYTVSYAYQGNVPTGASSLPANQSYQYEAEVTVAPEATAPGYTFSGWSRTGTFEMPAEDVEITGSFTSNNNTNYKVEHYKQNVYNNQFTLFETETKTGTTDVSVTATAKTYEGFTFDNSIPGTMQSGTISGDGNLTLKLYYTRNSYTVSYAYTSAPVSASLLPADNIYKFEEVVTVESDATALGYTFSGWSRTGTFTMPAEDVEITGSFTANTNTPYKIEHYTKDLNANTYTLRETENKTGTTDTLATANAKTYEGFTFNNSINGTVQNGYISGDGNLTLKLYYTRNSYNVSYAYQGNVPTGASSLPSSQNYEYGAEVTVAADSTAPGYTFSGWNRTGTFTMPAEDVTIKGSFSSDTDTTYKVEHYKENINSDTYSLFETDTLSGETDTEVTATPNTYAGFTFNSGRSTTTGIISGDGNLVLKLYYNRNSYTVSYAYQGNVPTGASNLPASQNYEYGAEVTVAADSTAPGYTFSGWSRNGTFTMPAENVEITGSFTANTNTPYKIEHYTKDLNADTFTLRDLENKTGETNTSITAIPKDYEGFTFDPGASTQTGTILGDGSLVLKLYYNRNSYNVSYAYQGNVPTGASSLPASQSYEYGAEVTVAADSTAPGYTFSGWSRTGTFTMPAQDVEITGSFDANTDTPYKVEYYLEIEHTGEYLLKDEYTLTGKTDTEVNAEAKGYSGYRQDDSIDGTKKTGIIAGDGSLVLKLYYKNTNYKYKVEYYFDGELDSALEEILEGEIDSQVSSNPVTPVRHGENSYTLVSKNHIITISSNNDDNIIKVYYETDVLDYEIDNSSEATDGDGIPDKYQVKINYKVENGTWDDGTTRQKTNIITLRDNNGELSEQGTGELTIPQVGNKPAEGYAKGFWIPELPNKVSKADDGNEYKYTYKEQGEIEEPTKEEPAKTEVTPKEPKSSNPKTQDIMPTFLLIGTTGIVILMIAKIIRRKYSRKAKKIQY